MLPTTMSAIKRPTIIQANRSAIATISFRMRMMTFIAASVPGTVDGGLVRHAKPDQSGAP